MLLHSPENWYWKVQDLTSSSARKFLHNILDWDNADDKDLEEIAQRVEMSCNLIPDAFEEDDRYIREPTSWLSIVVTASLMVALLIFLKTHFNCGYQFGGSSCIYIASYFDVLPPKHQGRIQGGGFGG